MQSELSFSSVSMCVGEKRETNILGPHSFFHGHPHLPFNEVCENPGIISLEPH